MKIKIKFSHILPFMFILLWGCASIEDSDFFKPTKTSSYLLDAYTGKTDIAVGSDYKVDITLINTINFQSFNGQSEATIHGIYVGNMNDINNRKIIIYSHDRAGNIDNYWPRIKLLANLGLDEYHILAFDYRGYGRSSGSPGEESIYADADAALQWLRDQGVIDENIILYGFGLGASSTLELGSNPRSLQAKQIIIEAPFASIEALIQNDLLQNIPGTYLSDLSFNNVDKAKHLSQKMLWLHGTRDNIYDLKTQGQLVFDAHPGSPGVDKFAIKVNGANHTNIPEKIQNGFDGYLLQLRSFLESN